MMRAGVRLSGGAIGLGACIAGLCAWLVGSRVLAGPVEVFSDVLIDPADPAYVVAPYANGGGGMFVSRDGGQTFGMRCAAQLDPGLVGSDVVVHASAQRLYVGWYRGVARGDQAGCGFSALSELSEHVVAAIASDPLEPQRTYVATSDPDPALNGLYVIDGPDAVAQPFGTRERMFLTTLHVVQRGSARRFYATGVTNDPVTNDTHYYVRVSDDDAQTWQQHAYALDQFGPKVSYAEFAVLAVDPADPDRVYARVRRNLALDSLVYSADRGASWSLLAEPETLDALAFAPDGRVFFGDNDQNAKGLYVLDAPSTAGELPTPRALDRTWPVGCLHYDHARGRMLACQGQQLGTAELTAGTFTSLFDMRCAQHFAECPSAPAGHDACAAQLFPINFCDPTHQPVAPLCEGYDDSQLTADFVANVIGYSCTNGEVQLWSESSIAGGDGAENIASSGGAAGVSIGEPAATSGSSLPPASSSGDSHSSGGCNISQGSRADGSAIQTALLSLALWFSTRRRKHRMSLQQPRAAWIGLVVFQSQGAPRSVSEHLEQPCQKQLHEHADCQWYRHHHK